MRLTCPNCGAQYEVPEDVVPTEGRDVQCSNCGNTWFQSHPDYPPVGLTLESDSDGAQMFDSVPDAEFAPENKDQPDPDHGLQSELLPEDDDLSPDPTAERPELDSSISSILREEADRESQLRAEENSSLETQPDLGLENFPGDPAAVRAKQARDRMAAMRGETPEPIDPGSRRSLLPDIEEINSTLRSQDEPAKAASGAQAAPAEQAQKSGFSRGFSLALVLVAVLILIYAKAPLIAEKVPQVNSALNGYVSVIDQARNGLDQLIGSAIPR